MNDDTKPAVPGWYGKVAAVALLWSLLGCAIFGMELFGQEAAMESFTEAQKQWARDTPGWIYFVFGLAVSTGVAGSVGLLLRRGWCVAVYAIGLAAVLVQMAYTMVIAGGLQVMGPSGAIMPGVVIVFAGLLLWYSRSARTKGWLFN